MSIFHTRTRYEPDQGDDVSPYDPDREVEIPAGEAVTIHASHAEPKWIAPAGADLHIRVNGYMDEPLFAAHGPRLITAPTAVREPNGHPSGLLVTDHGRNTA